MKKLLFILTLSLVACRKVETVVVVPVNTNIFSTPQSSVTNGQEIQFDLIKDGVYTLTIGDSINNQILTRERFNGKIGINKKKIYTNTLQSKYLYLLLEDVTKTKISKTTIIIK